MFKVEMERHETGDVKSVEAVAEAKDELANGKEALPVLEVRVSVDELGMPSPMEDCAGVQGELVTASAKLHVAKRAFPATLELIKRNSNKLQAAEIAVQVCIKSRLRNYIETVLDQVRQRPEVYQLNV